MPSGILLNNRQITHQELLDNQFSDSGLSEFEYAVIFFYRQWHSDKTEFEFQTSGTTGTPKKISFHRDQLIHSGKLTCKTLDLKHGQNCLLCLSPNFVAGKMMMVRAFVNSMHLIATEPSSNPLKNISSDVHFMAIVPNQLHAILTDRNSFKKFNQIEKVIVGGGDIISKDWTLLSEVRNEVYHTYAMTETLTHVAWKKIGGTERENSFSVLEGFQIAVDERSCLKIKSPYQTGWLTTNDLVEVIDDRHFDWKGRIDHVVNSGGIKIIPEEVEPVVARVLNSLNVNNTFFLAGISDNKLGQKLVLMLEGELKMDPEKVLKELKSELREYKYPKDVILMAEFVYTETGKINRTSTMAKLKQK